jgi:hypothetical protein
VDNHVDAAEKTFINGVRRDIQGARGRAVLETPAAAAQRDHSVPPLQQLATDFTPDETRGAGYQTFHKKQSTRPCVSNPAFFPLGALGNYRAAIIKKGAIAP